MTTATEETNDLVEKFRTMTNKVMYSDYMMPFGKYTGQYLSYLVDLDRPYLEWAIDHTSSEELVAAIRFHLKEADEYAERYRSRNKEEVSGDSGDVQ